MRLWLCVLCACHARITDVGPRVVSNQTSQPLTLVGTRFRPGLEVSIGQTKLQATVIDATHAYARLPAGVAAGDYQIGEATLRVIDDEGFVDPFTFVIGDKPYVASPTNDTVYAPDARKVGDGPRALAWWNGLLVIAHQFEPTLWVGDKRYPAPAGASAMAVREDVAYVTGQVRDELWAIDLKSGKQLWRADVAPNPMSIAIAGDSVAVGGMNVQRFSFDGKLLATIAPDKQTQITGGQTAEFTQYIMGGKAIRGMVWAGGKLYVSSIGPNIGPNPKKLEVTHAAGVGVIENDRYTHHVALGAGVTEGMATDGKRLFVADIASGYVHVYDLSPSLLQTIVIPPPADFPFVRPDVPGEVHSGPRALAVKDDTLYVLNRFTGAIAEIDLKSLSLRKQTAVAPMLAQKERRLGQILYYADIGRSGMSCDSCHPEGHMDGVFFEKTKPLRIYRSTTVRGSMQTPPYFIPTSTHSLHETNALVGNRNRFQRKKLSHQELAALTLFSAQVTTLPNPFVDPDGAPVESLTLPDGETGHPRRGLTIFERGCQKCHPAPLFTLDQDPATRDQHFDVGTDKVFPLDTQWQDASTTRFPPPSLVGVWDEFPLFTAATAGLVTNDKGQLVVGTRFPLRNKHLGTLSREDENDLLAYLLSL